MMPGRRFWRAIAMSLGAGGLLTMVFGEPFLGSVVVEQAAIVAAILSL
jgi:hypothetical protein